MNTLHITQKSRAGALTSFAETFAEGFAAVKANVAAGFERRRVFAELSRMSERDLADIGIGRGDISRIAGSAELPLTIAARR